MDQHTMKLADFLEHLKKLPADAELTFGKGNLQFQGIKKQSEKLFRIDLDAPTTPRSSVASFRRD